MAFHPNLLEFASATMLISDVTVSQQRHDGFVQCKG